MLQNLFEDDFYEGNIKTFLKNQAHREKAEELLSKYINKFLKAPPEQKKELKELISLCLDFYKDFVSMQKIAMRMSKKSAPKVIERRLKQKPDLERLN